MINIKTVPEVNRSTYVVPMAIVQEFVDGLCKVQPDQWFDSEESHNQTAAAEDSSGSVTPDDTQNKRQAEVEPQLPKEEEIPKVQEELQNEELLRKPEEHHHQQQLLNSCETQPLPEEAESKGNPSGQTENSETDRIQSESDSNDFPVSPPPVPVPRLPWDVLPPGSKPKGVSYHKNNKQWEAHLWIQGRQLRNRRKKGVQVFVGNYSTEDEAKQAHDRAAIKFEVRSSGRARKPYPLNFPESAQADFIAEHKDWSLRDFLWKLRRHSLKFNWGKSSMKGVTVRESIRKRRIISPRGEPGSGETTSIVSLRYEARITKTDGRKMTCTIGAYGSEEEAGKAYDRALLFMNKDKGEAEQWHVITNFRPSDYSAEEVLEAGKKLVFK